MYEINVSNRRVTQYITEEAYKWLYQKIVAGEYQANRCKAGKRLLVEIQEQQSVSEENYTQFVDLMDNSPYSYMMYRSKRSASKHITTDQLFNYFVKYNGQILPLGFIKDFFEDDYETQREINELLEQYTVGENNAINVQWRKTLITREESLDRLKSVFPNMFRLHPSLVITQILRTVMVVLRALIIVSFLKAVDFFEVMGQFTIANGFDLQKDLTAVRTMDAFQYGGVFCHVGDSFKMGEYFSAYGAHFVVAILATLLLISKIKLVINFLIFLVRVIINNVRVAISKMNIHIFEKKGLDSISNYFKGVAGDMVAEGVITDDHCKSLPKALCNTYNAVYRLDIPTMCDKLGVLNAKYYAKQFAYDEKDLPVVKANWRSGLVGYIIITFALSVMLFQPMSNLIVPSIITFVTSIFG